MMKLMEKSSFWHSDNWMGMGSVKAVLGNPPYT